MCKNYGRQYWQDKQEKKNLKANGLLLLISVIFSILFIGIVTILVR